MLIIGVENMNKKGQALVEFVIILPILLCILFAMIDFGIIIYNKSRLESKINDVVDMINNNEKSDIIMKFINEDTNKKTTYNVITKDKYIEVNLSSSINIITPGLNIILDNPYKIEAKRVIYEK